MLLPFKEYLREVYRDVVELFELMDDFRRYSGWRISLTYHPAEVHDPDPISLHRPDSTTGDPPLLCKR
jgi:hypothetical protein